MLVFQEKNEIRDFVLQARQQGKTIALVPTMGCLHAGHLSLIRIAKQHADVVIVSIYVNPLQFGPHEDLIRYPRPLEADLDQCKLESVDAVFNPDSLYPSQGIAVSLGVDGLDELLCGQSRAGHFNGVVTVVTILFNIIQPDVAIFGEKDFQQLCILRRMVNDLSIPIDIIAGPIIRTEQGLALSSRNRYLNSQEKLAAIQLHRCLQGIAQKVREDELDVSQLLQWGRFFLVSYPLTVQYLEILDSEKLQTLHHLSQHCGRVFIAANLGQTRLIDNLELPCK